MSARCRCFKAKGNRTIELNHRLRKYRQKAKEHFELDVDTEDALAGYADHSFDAITLWHVMEHLEHLNETWGNYSSC